MSWTKRFMWAFWIFVGVMLCWQLYSCNDKIAQAAAQPKQDHFFFYQTSDTSRAVAAAPVHTGPYVEQTNFTVNDNTPENTSFTCHVTLKNTGQSKAINVEVCVRPYLGALADDDDVGTNTNKVVTEDSPRGQINQYVTFPDLDPGESSTQSVVFTKQSSADWAFGNNPRPEIAFQSEKGK